MGLSKNVTGNETVIRRTFAMNKINIDLLDYHPPMLIPTLALSKAPQIGAEVDNIMNTEQVMDLLTPKDSS